MRGEVRDIFMDWLRQYRPDLVPRYERLYSEGPNLPPAERRRIGALLRRPESARGGARRVAPFRDPHEDRPPAPSPNPAPDPGPRPQRLF